jgi:hypothetical protein
MRILILAGILCLASGPVIAQNGYSAACMRAANDSDSVFLPEAQVKAAEAYWNKCTHWQLEETEREYMVFKMLQNEQQEQQNEDDHLLGLPPAYPTYNSPGSP